MGSIIQNAQVVFVSESFNDFTPSVNIMTAPQIVVSVEITSDEYGTFDISCQIWQISSGEVAVAWDVNRKASDGSITQSDLLLLDWICLTTTHVLQDILAVLHKEMCLRVAFIL